MGAMGAGLVGNATTPGRPAGFAGKRRGTREGSLMTIACIPVDLFNPGQVFACLGFLEAADALLGDARGNFDWRHESDVRFVMDANTKGNPFAAILEFLSKAKVYSV